MVQQHGVQLVTDAVSYELLKGATVDYTTDLIRASFEVRILGLGIASIGLNKHSHCPSQIASFCHICKQPDAHQACWFQKEKTPAFRITR